MRAPWNGARGERGVVMDGVGEHVGRRLIFLELCIVSPDTAAGALSTESPVCTINYSLRPIIEFAAGRGPCFTAYRRVLAPVAKVYQKRK